MSVIVENDHGCIIDHLKASVITVNISKNGETDDNCDYHYRLKSDLFNIVEPYRMDSQFDKLQSTLNTPNKEGHKNKRKRKRCEPLNVGEQMAVDFHNEVKGYIEKAYKSLLDIGNTMNYFLTQTSLSLHDNNVAAREAALLGGFLHSFIDMCGQSYNDWNQKCQEYQYTGTPSYTDSSIDTQQNRNQAYQVNGDEHESRLKHDLPTVQISEVTDLASHGTVNVKWQNSDQCAQMVQCRGDNFIIPANSTFLISDVSQLNKTGKALGKFDLIVMDPPWTNKSVKRKKKYYTMDNDMLLDLPLCDLMNPGCVVVVWVTNKQKHLQFVTEQLFPSKNIKYRARWYWLKVTQTGECVFNIDSPHKKPYETLIIGKYLPVTMETVNNLEMYDLDSYNNGLHSLEKKLSANCDPINTTDSGQEIKLDIHQDIIENGSSSNGNYDNLGHVPDKKVIISVPCSLHSKKPPLTEVLKQYLPDDPKCLEMFARNLLPDWTSWGNEVLLHQHENFYEKIT